MYASPKIYKYGSAYSNDTDLVDGFTSSAYTAFLYYCNNTFWKYVSTQAHDEGGV
jgi:hypothetical protein